MYLTGLRELVPGKNCCTKSVSGTDPMVDVIFEIFEKINIFNFAFELFCILASAIAICIVMCYTDAKAANIRFQTEDKILNHIYRDGGRTS